MKAVGMKYKGNQERELLAVGKMIQARRIGVRLRLLMMYGMNIRNGVTVGWTWTHAHLVSFSVDFLAYLACRVLWRCFLFDFAIIIHVWF